MYSISIDEINSFDKTELKSKWAELLKISLIGKESAISRFINDEDKGFLHSFKVYKKALECAHGIAQTDDVHLDYDAIEQLSVFHDIGKFFQDLPTWENLKISQDLYREFSKAQNVTNSTTTKVFEGIPATDFYCRRLEPSGTSPQSLEAEIVRVSDKMQDNLVPKVDRYWFEYGVPRNATFFDPSLTFADREKFSFENFCGDQMNLILTIISLRSQDISHPLLGRMYEEWSTPMKDQVVNRILALASELGESSENICQIQALIIDYRDRYSC